jgi:hypothetical protein
MAVLISEAEMGRSEPRDHAGSSLEKPDRFRLTKWYLDAVAEDGTAFIGYAVDLNWGVLRVRYCATLISQPNKTVTERHTLRNSPDPQLDEDGVIRWSCPPLQLQGEWSSRCASVRRKLFASKAGEVVWECLAPAAAANLTLRSQRMTATGYVERLTLTAPPWTLGLDQLHWGRFIAKDACIVWIDWRGPEPRRLVLLNGNDVEDAIIHKDSILLPAPGARLELAQHKKSGERQSRILREGPLVNIFSTVPGLANALPRWLGQGHESRRLSRARLESNDAPDRDGWAIHEVVTWRSRVPV